MTPDWVSKDGRIVLFRGDNLDVLPTLQDCSVTAIASDPPYGFSADGSSRKNIGRYQGSGSRGGRCEWRELDCEDWNDELPVDWLKDAFRVLKPGGAITAFTDSLKPSTYWEEYEKIGLHPLRVLYWVKTNPPTNPSKSYTNDVEVAVFGRKPGKVLAWRGGKTMSNVIYHPKVDYRIKVHPTQKPLKVMDWILKPITSGKPEDVILDPFLGGGTTAVVCMKRGYHFIGIEKKEEYFEKAVARIEAEDKQGKLF